MSANLGAIRVKLKPVMPLRSSNKLGKDTTESISDVSGRTVKWMDDGCVVLNGDSGKGVDIFMMLDRVDKNGKVDGKVLILDQRKLWLSNIQSNEMKNIFKLMQKVVSALPDYLKKNVVVVYCIFSPFSLWPLPVDISGDNDMPHHWVLVGRKEIADFHGDGLLKTHPACFPKVYINFGELSDRMLSLVFEHTAKEILQFLREEIKANREEQKCFENERSLKDFVEPVRMRERGKDKEGNEREPIKIQLKLRKGFEEIVSYAYR